MPSELTKRDSATTTRARAIVVYALALPLLLLAGNALCAAENTARRTTAEAIVVSGLDRGHHGDGVTKATLSRDGRRLATYSGCLVPRLKLTLIVWDVATGKALWEVEQGVAAFLFSADSHALITVGTSAPDHAERIVTHWDTETGQRLQTLPPCPRMSRENNTFSPDGSRIVVAIRNAATASLTCWDIQSTNVIWKAQIDYVQPPWYPDLPTIAFSPDGKKVAAGTEEGVCVLFDGTDGQELGRINAHANQSDDHRNQVHSLAFSPNGARIAASFGEGMCVLWNTEDGAVSRRWRAHSSRVTSIAFDPDGRTVATGSWDNSISLWNVESGKQLRTLEDTGMISRVAFTPDGRNVLAASWLGCATLWNAESGQVVKHFGLNTGAANCVTFSPDGTMILAGYSGSVALLWHAETGEVLRSFTRRDSSVYSVAFRRDSEMILVGYGILARLSDGTAILWNASTGKQVRRLVDETRNWMGSSSSVAFAPDGKLAFASRSLWDLETGGQLWSFTQFPVRSSQWSPDGSQVVMAGGLFDDAMSLCDAATGREQLSFGGRSKEDEFPSGPVDSVSFSLDGARLLVGGMGGVAIWDTATGNMMRVFRSGGHFTTVAFSPDGRRVLAASLEDNSAVLWDAASGQQIQVFEGHSGAINGVAFSPNGQKVVTASSDKSLILWDMKTGKKLRVFTTMILGGTGMPGMENSGDTIPILTE